MQRKIIFSFKVARLTAFMFFFIFFFFTPALTLADDPYGLNSAANEGGFTTSGTVDLAATIGQVIQIILSFVGVIFMILVIYGGFIWMFAQGNDEKTTKARNIIVTASIGVLIILSAYIITSIVTQQILKSVGETSEASAPTP